MLKLQNFFKFLFILFYSIFYCDFNSFGAVTPNKIQELEQILFHERSEINTEIFIVWKDDKILYEKFLNGYTKNTRHFLWSMSKSITAAFVGVCVDKNIISLEDKVEKYIENPYQKNGQVIDKVSYLRFQKLKIQDLLEMSSGFSWEESYDNPLKSSVAFMLYFPQGYKDMGQVPLLGPMIAEPSLSFHYSTGEYNLLMKVVQNALKQKNENPIEFPFKNFFEPLKMNSLVWEQDKASTYLGGSYMHATAYDVLNFGEMYLNQGVFQGKRILSESWVQYTIKLSNENKVIMSKDDEPYGAGFWLNKKTKLYPNKPYSDLPENVFAAFGHQGQFLFFVPDKKILVLRLAQDKAFHGKRQYRNKLMKKVLEIF
jgi:CubicO group peptidase (beta-lactamase class C family)